MMTDDREMIASRLLQIHGLCNLMTRRLKLDRWGIVLLVGVAVVTTHYALRNSRSGSSVSGILSRRGDIQFLINILYTHGHVTFILLYTYYSIV